MICRRGAARLFLIACAWCLFSSPAFSQLHTFVRFGKPTPDSRGRALSQRHWQVDAYCARDQNWLREIELDSASTVEAVFSVTTSTGQPIAEKRETINQADLSSASIQKSVTFPLQAGDYILRFELKNGEATLQRATESFTLKHSASRVELSDLIPTQYPRLQGPPFPKLLRVEYDPSALDLLLYYEIRTAAADTTVELRSTLETQDGETIRDERYAIVLYDGFRNDYLRVSLFNLRDGGYTVTLTIPETQPIMQKTFHFRKSIAAANLADRDRNDYATQY